MGKAEILSFMDSSERWAEVVIPGEILEKEWVLSINRHLYFRIRMMKLVKYISISALLLLAGLQKLH